MATGGPSLYAIEAATGEQRWVFSVPKQLTRLNLPTVGSDGTVYIGTGSAGAISSDNKLYALSGRTGRVRWSLPLSDRCSAAPLMGKNGRVYCLAQDTTLTAVDVAGGKALWHFSEPGWWTWVGGAAMDQNGIIFLALAPKVGAKPTRNEGRLVAIDSMRGAALWRHDYPRPFSTPTLGPDGTVYAGAFDGSIYAMDGKTGEPLWVFPTQESAVASPALTPAGILYCAGAEGGVFALNARTGELIWKVKAGARQVSAPVLNASGLLFVTSADQNIYAIRASDGLRSTEVIDP